MMSSAFSGHKAHDGDETLVTPQGHKPSHHLMAVRSSLGSRWRRPRMTDGVTVNHAAAWGRGYRKQSCPMSA